MFSPLALLFRLDDLCLGVTNRQLGELAHAAITPGRTGNSGTARFTRCAISRDLRFVMGLSAPSSPFAPSTQLSGPCWKSTENGVGRIPESNVAPSAFCSSSSSAAARRMC